MLDLGKLDREVEKWTAKINRPDLIGPLQKKVGDYVKFRPDTPYSEESIVEGSYHAMGGTRLVKKDIGHKGAPEIYEAYRDVLHSMGMRTWSEERLEKIQNLKRYTECMKTDSGRSEVLGKVYGALDSKAALTDHELLEELGVTGNKTFKNLLHVLLEEERKKGNVGVKNKVYYRVK